MKSNTTTTPLSGQTVCQGLPAEFSTSATGEGALTYAWTLDGVGIGGNAATLTVDTGSVTLGNHEVCVTVNGECGNAHQCAALLVRANTSITTPPEPRQVCFGSSVLQVFSVEASGTAPLTYAWTLDGVPFNGNSPSISINPSALVVGIHSIGVTVTGSCGLAVSASTTLTVNLRPGCTITGPANVILGSTVTYSVPEAAGLSYSWSLSDNTANASFAGATNATNPEYCVVGITA